MNRILKFAMAAVIALVSGGAQAQVTGKTVLDGNSNAWDPAEPHHRFARGQRHDGHLPRRRRRRLRRLPRDAQRQQRRRPVDPGRPVDGRGSRVPAPGHRPVVHLPHVPRRQRRPAAPPGPTSSRTPAPTSPQINYSPGGDFGWMKTDLRPQRRARATATAWRPPTSASPPSRAASLRAARTPAAPPARASSPARAATTRTAATAWRATTTWTWTGPSRDGPRSHHPADLVVGLLRQPAHRRTPPSARTACSPAAATSRPRASRARSRSRTTRPSPSRRRPTTRPRRVPAPIGPRSPRRLRVRHVGVVPELPHQHPPRQLRERRHGRLRPPPPGGPGRDAQARPVRRLQQVRLEREVHGTNVAGDELHLARSLRERRQGQLQRQRRATSADLTKLEDRRANNGTDTDGHLRRLGASRT